MGSIEAARVTEVSAELFTALTEGATVRPLAARGLVTDVADAYAVSRSLLARRLARGERVVGKKIGLTSSAVQEMLGVHEPDYGILTDAMVLPNASEIGVRDLIQPRIEGEIAFLLARDLAGPGVTPEMVLRATEAVCPCFEVVDSRIQNWEITILDTVADNASCGLAVLGPSWVAPDGFDFSACTLQMYRGEELVASGTGAAALGSPLNSVAWLANALAGHGELLRAGEIVLSGSLVPLFDAVRGDAWQVAVGGLGTASLTFC